MSKYFKTAKEKVVLKDHQQRVVNKLSEPNRTGLLIYHGLGSGKTISSIMAAKNNNAKTTVVTPASLQENYKKEIKKTDASSKNFDIKSYNKFTKDPTDNPNKDMLILDEAHAIRNVTSKRSQAVLNNVKDYKKVVLLTGTPIQNKPYEIGALINAVAKSKRLPHREKEFNEKYLKKEVKTPNIIDRIFRGAKPYVETSAKNLDDFRSKTKGLVDYHAPSQSDDYPTTETVTSKVNMSEKQQLLYKYYASKLPKHLKYKISESLAPDKKEIGQLNSFLSATRQIGNSSGKFSINEKASPKIKAISRRIRKSDSSSVVYSNYLENGLMPLSKRLTSRGVSHGVFTGKLNKDQKHDLVKNYNSGKLKALLVSSSGGEGLDLKNTGSVHIMEPHWNEPKIDQVIGRAVRFKSHESLPKDKRNVKIYKYLSDAPDTVTADEYLNAMGKKKKELNNKFLNVLKNNE